MNDTLKKLTEETKSALLANLSSKSFLDLIASTKAATEESSGSFKVIVSTADVDRQGESVDQNGWDLSFFKANPVVLWAHDYSSLPIGVCTNITLENGKLIAEGKFAPSEANPFAQQVRRLYDLGMVRATSVGFIPREFDQNIEGKINRSELLEFSFVPVPANPHALSLSQIKEFKIDTGLLKTKGIEVIEQKEAAAGDACEVDGQTGVLETGADGTLVCTVKAAKATPAESLKTSLATENIEHTSQLGLALNAFKEALKTIDMTKSIDLDSMECFKEYTSKVALENQRHSKALEDMTEKAVKDFAEHDDNEEGGNATASAKLEEINNEIKAVKTLLTEHIALGKQAEGGNGAGDGTNNQRSNNSEGLKDVNDFIETRTLLRSIDNSIEKVLRNFNIAAKDKSKK